MSRSSCYRAVFRITPAARKMCTSVHAHSAGHPWPAGDDLSQTPRSATSTGERLCNIGLGKAPAHAGQRPEPMLPGPCSRSSRCPARRPTSTSHRAGSQGRFALAGPMRPRIHPQMTRSPPQSGLTVPPLVGPDEDRPSPRRRRTAARARGWGSPPPHDDTLGPERTQHSHWRPSRVVV
jgi:hypothetical protein